VLLISERLKENTSDEVLASDWSDLKLVVLNWVNSSETDFIGFLCSESTSCWYLLKGDGKIVWMISQVISWEVLSLGFPPYREDLSDSFPIYFTMSSCTFELA